MKLIEQFRSCSYVLMNYFARGKHFCNCVKLFLVKHFHVSKILDSFCGWCVCVLTIFLFSLGEKTDNLRGLVQWYSRISDVPMVKKFPSPEGIVTLTLPSPRTAIVPIIN